MMRKLFLLLVFILFGAGAEIMAQQPNQSLGANGGCTIFTPNAFTPNGDGKNDLFKLTVPENCEVIKFSMQIFDRWGRRVFTTDDVFESWDGTFDGQILEEGVYLWYYTATLRKVNDPEVNEQEKRGTAILIR